PPAVQLQQPAVGVVPFAQVERQLQLLAGPAGEVRERQEGDALVVVVADLLAVGDPRLLPRLAGPPPTGDRGEGRAAGVAGVRPAVQANRRAGVQPEQAAVREPRRGCPDRLADGEVEVVAAHTDLAGADPELEQARVDVHQGRAAEAGEQARV